MAQNKVSNKSFGLNADSIESYLVMPKRGMLVVRIWGIQHLDVPLPGYSTFKVHFIKGDSTKTDSLINSIPLSFDSLYGWFNFCGPPPVLNRMWYSYFSDPAYEFDLGGVNEGDTVQFIYHSDNVNNGEPIDYGYNQTNKILGKIKELPSGLILGENPDPAQIDNYIVDNIIKAIQLYESHNFQFEYDKDKSWPFNQEGWPIYGEPNGYGLMQLDNSPAATERQLWNWKANIDGAKYKFYTLIKSNNTDNFLDKHPDTVTEEMRLKSAYQKYNFFGWDKGKKSEHYYYMWDGKNGILINLYL
ncbi:MAG TPA: hypothetical protein VI230_03145 [Ignavibacteriaceae bacterium]